MASIFTMIINGEIPSYKVAEDEHYYAFLDINPMQKGHTLVVPKREEDYLFDLSDEELAGMMVFAKKVAKAIKKSISCQRGDQEKHSLQAGWCCRVGIGCSTCSRTLGSFG